MKKKSILSFVCLFLLGTVSCFAYDNGVGVFAMSYDSTTGSWPPSATQIINISNSCQIEFRCSFTYGGSGRDYASSGYAFLRHGGTYVDTFNFNRMPNDPFSNSTVSTHTGYWYVLELTVNCSYNSIGQAELRW